MALLSYGDFIVFVFHLTYPQKGKENGGPSRVFGLSLAGLSRLMEKKKTNSTGQRKKGGASRAKMKNGSCRKMKCAVDEDVSGKTRIVIENRKPFYHDSVFKLAQYLQVGLKKKLLRTHCNHWRLVH
ncbi:hypothetical protein AVEN_78097-1 [Araneus ventricosus]|uniref:Uncharacterized protein n=1 Tax=Araneus ventricosus TaxID=182803 RepID=A0A4Y2F369_ARAVE|nr:hypothetical protein AVEN_78097-1 [Araneus ventricosus]